MASRELGGNDTGLTENGSVTHVGKAGLPPRIEPMPPGPWMRGILLYQCRTRGRSSFLPGPSDKELGKQKLRFSQAWAHTLVISALLSCTVPKTRKTKTQRLLQGLLPSPMALCHILRQLMMQCEPEAQRRGFRCRP